MEEEPSQGPWRGEMQAACKAPRTGGSLVGSRAAELAAGARAEAVPVQRVWQGPGEGALSHGEEALETHSHLPCRRVPLSSYGYYWVYGSISQCVDH